MRELRSMTPGELFITARDGLASDQDRNAPAIAQEMLRRFDRVLRVLPPMFHQWILTGLTKWVRDRLKAHGVGDGSTRASQLELWPEQFREHVVAIGDLCVYLPSEDRFRDVTPDLTNEQLDEAGDYKIKLGFESIQAGQACKALAAARRAAATTH